MSAKIVWPCALVLAVLGAWAAWADTRYPAEGTVSGTQARNAFGGGPIQGEGMPAPGELSSWIKYGRPGCCDPLGRDGPIDSELFFRVGPSLPVAGGIINNTLAVGWSMTAGGRSLFFDPSQTAAWTVELSISHIYNNASKRNFTFDLVPFASATALEPRTGSVRALHRTFGSLGLGREWYLNGAADDRSHYWAFWRFGADAGARLGTARMDFNEDRPPPENFQRTHDVFWAAYAAVHTDVEIPYGCCIFHAGFRAEWQYSWLDVFPNDARSNLHDLNLLFNAGVRF